MSDDAAESQRGSRIEVLPFTATAISTWQDSAGRHRNWPVVYTISNSSEVYVGETLNARSRMRQHLASVEKQQLRTVRVIVDASFNKSASLDLESFLIRMFSGDGRFDVLNLNVGVTDADYFQRAAYRTKFREIFEHLHTEGLFTKRIAEIENSDLFKLSPFKALNTDQEQVIEDILDGLFADIQHDANSTAVVQGGPGTGKTIVAIYLLKMIVDIRDRSDDAIADIESVFSEFFTPDHPELLRGARIGLVVPQQSLRASIKKVFKRTPGLSEDMVLTPFDVVKAELPFDLLVVDETHRLTQYASQAHPTLTNRYVSNSQALAREGEDWTKLTQIDWIVRSSRHQVFLLDEGQGVRPADVPHEDLDTLRRRARDTERRYRLRSQMRVQAGGDYLAYVRGVLSDSPPDVVPGFAGYDLRFYDDAGAMYDAIIARDDEHGLARLVAGFAWKWVSKNPKKGAPPLPGVFDVVVGDLKLQWNGTATDWINSPTSLREVGSIHTVQGYDLNYAGVIVGPELYYDRATRRIKLDRDRYFDTRGKARKDLRGGVYSDEDTLVMVKNAYNVLLTRGIRGTYVYVCDPALREHLRRFFPAVGG